MELLGHELGVHVCLLGTTKQLAKVAVQFYTPTGSVWELQLLHVLAISPLNLAILVGV